MTKTSYGKFLRGHEKIETKTASADQSIILEYDRVRCLQPRQRGGKEVQVGGIRGGRGGKVQAREIGEECGVEEGSVSSEERKDTFKESLIFGL